MNTIKINDLVLELINYSKNTNFIENHFRYSIACTVNTNITSEIEALLLETITSIEIYVKDNLIYELKNISGKIENLNEYFVSDHMATTINLILDKE